MSMHILEERHVHTQHARLGERQREKVGVVRERDSVYIHPSIECCVTSRHADLQDLETPPVYLP